MIKRLALTRNYDIKEIYVDEKEDLNEYCNKDDNNNFYLDIQKNNESNEEFLNRISLAQRYSCYICNDEDLNRLALKFNNMIPFSLIDVVNRESNGESWIIAYGYSDNPYCNKGSWGKTEVYPFVTSDGKTTLDMFNLTYEDLKNINDNNFVTAFNKNKDIIDFTNPSYLKENNIYVLDKSKKIYKAEYPDVNDYEHVYVKHIPSYMDKMNNSKKRKEKNKNKKNKSNI